MKVLEGTFRYMIGVLRIRVKKYPTDQQAGWTSWMYQCREGPFQITTISEDHNNTVYHVASVFHLNLDWRIGINVSSIYLEPVTFNNILILQCHYILSAFYWLIHLGTQWRHRASEMHSSWNSMDQSWPARSAAWFTLLGENVGKNYALKK